MRKVLSFIGVMFVVLMLAACDDVKKYDVTFDLDYEGAAAAEVIKVDENKAVAKPTDPERDGYRFLKWLLDGEEYDFEAKVTKDVVLKAFWIEDLQGVHLTVTVPEGTKNVYVVGTFNEWKVEEAVALEKQDDGTFKVFLSLDEDVDEVKYKYVNGLHWNYVEKDADGEEMDDREYVPQVDNRVSNTVEKWAEAYSEVTVKFDPSYGEKEKDEDGKVVDDYYYKIDKAGKYLKAAKPADPERDKYEFKGWFADLEDEKPFDFAETAVNADLVLYAKWQALPPSITGYKPVYFVIGKDVKPDWLEGVSGLDIFEKVVAATVNDEAVDLEEAGEYNLVYTVEDDYGNKVTARAPVLVVTQDQDALYKIELPDKVSANLELPTSVGDVAVTWTSSVPAVIATSGTVTPTKKNSVVKLTAKAGDAEREYWVTVYGTEVDLNATYRSSFGEIQTLNPLMATGVSDSDVYDNLVASFYGGDYDWEKAMADGYAEYPGDFSRIYDAKRNPGGDVHMPSIALKRTMGITAKYPYAVNLGVDNTIEGSYGKLLDQEAAKETLDNKWIITLKEGLQFEDGTPITTEVVEYSFQQYLNPLLQNERANYLYDGDYISLLNGKEYFDSKVLWRAVGFRKIDDYAFEIELTGKATQYHVMTYLGIVNLVHPTKFEAGLNLTGSETNYGSVENPLSSYGAFTLRNDYEDTEKFTFDRNENYHSAWNIPFKVWEGPIIKDQKDVINEFKAGNLDVAGVGGEFWEEFQDHENLYVSPSNSFYRLAISIERPNNPKPILAYAEFRRALYLATDRNDFANNVQPPSEGALGYLSNIHQVSEWASQAYASSDKHKQQLEDLGLEPEQGGYDSAEALALFKSARAAAIADGHYAEGEVIKIEFLYYDAGSNIRIANWVKEQYEEVFNPEGETNLEVILKPVSSDELNKQRTAGDFDLIFTGMSGATFQATFGMGYIFSPSFSTFLAGKGHGIPEAEVKGVEMTNLFDIVKVKTAYVEATVKANDGKVPEGMRTLSEDKFYNALKETDGVYNGTFDGLYLLWNGTAEFKADYDGQEEDLTNITAGLEAALLKQMIAVPLFSSTSAAVYQNNIVRLAPAYSLFMGWGGMSYMYKTVAASE